MKFYCEDNEKVLDELRSSREGLSSDEAARRLEQNGKNKLAAAKGKSLVRRFLEQLTDPMIIILLVAAFISGVLAVLEDESFADVIIILAVVTASNQAHHHNQGHNQSQDLHHGFHGIFSFQIFAIAGISPAFLKKVC